MMSSPNAVSVVQVGTSTYVFVTDTLFNRVLGWDVSSGIGNLLTGDHADYLLGQPDYQTRGTNSCGGATVIASSLHRPKGIAKWEQSPTNRILWVTDKLNFRVVGYDLEDMVATPIGMDATYVLGHTDLVSGGYIFPWTSSSIRWPDSVAIDQNYIFVYFHSWSGRSVSMPMPR